MRTGTKTRVPEPTVRLFLTACGVIELCCVLQHVGFGVLALTSPRGGGDSGTEMLRVMTYCSPLLAVLSFCGAALAFSGRTARRRPHLAGASFLVVMLMCALLVAGSVLLLIGHAGGMALVWPMSLAPTMLPLVCCRLMFRSAQRHRPDTGTDLAGTDAAR